MLKQKHLTTVLLLLTAIVASYFIFFKQPEYMKIRELTEMDYNNIQLAKLPQDQLFTYEQAEALKEKAFYEGFPTIKDEQAMLELTKHAYQWDKNAMIAYAQIVRDFRTRPSDGDAITLADFLKKYSYELVDEQGKPLETPALFQLEYNDFLKVLANKGYAEPAKLLFYKMPDSMGKEQVRQETINYLRTIVNSGHGFNVALANTILFNTSNGTKERGNNQLETMNNHNPSISDTEIKEAIKNYQIMAEYGSDYAMYRLSEAYYYGVGVEKDSKTALAWAELSNKAFDYYLKLPKENTNNYQQQIKETINYSNVDLTNRIKQELSEDEINQANIIKDKLTQTILSWNYEEWKRSKEPLPIQP